MITIMPRRTSRRGAETTWGLGPRCRRIMIMTIVLMIIIILLMILIIVILSIMMIIIIALMINK